MLGLPRSTVYRLLLTSTIGLGVAPRLMAQDAAALPPAAAPAGVSPEDRQLRNDVDAYFHYAWIARYDLAAQFAQKIVDESADPAALIPVLQDIAKAHDPNSGYMAQLLYFDNQADLKDTTDKLLLKVQAGNIARSQDPTLIEETIRSMSVGERGYENNLP